MSCRCFSWQGNGRRAHTVCTLCGQVAVFHWRVTYPDLLLCAECLACYPEVGFHGSSTHILMDESIEKCRQVQSWRRLLDSVPSSSGNKSAFWRMLDEL